MAQGPAMADLKKSYEEEVGKAVLPLREGYRKALLTLEGQMAAKGDYSGARRVQEERRELDRQMGRTAALPDATPATGRGRILLGTPVETAGGLRMADGGWSGWETAGGMLRWTLAAGWPGGGYDVEITYVSGTDGTLGLGLKEDFHTLGRNVKLPAAPEGGSDPGRIRLGPLRMRPGAAGLELKITTPGTVPDLKVLTISLVPTEEAS